MKQKAKMCPLKQKTKTIYLNCVCHKQNTLLLPNVLLLPILTSSQKWVKHDKKEILSCNRYIIGYVHVQRDGHFEFPNVCVPIWSWTRWNSAFLFQLSYCKQVSISWSAQYHVFTLGGFSLIILLFKMASKHSVQVLFTVPKCKKVMMCLIVC